MFSYKELSKRNKAYIIAEIGANHNGDIELAKNLIEEAKSCGADCVKFQSWDKKSLISNVVYRNNSGLEETVDKYHINDEAHFELKHFCDSIGIDFSSTPFSKREVDLLVDKLDVPFIKVASMDLNNIPFLKYIATKRKPVVLSTGLCGLGTICNAVECLEENGCSEIVLLHCVSMYPPKDEMVNLNNIDMLRSNFEYPVGYSDHTIGVVAPIMAMAKNACVIEKHFTLDKDMEGWDHKVSANPAELREICAASEQAYKMLGTYRRKINETKEQRSAFQRSIVASRFISNGEVISEDDVDFKRPGTGISPEYIGFVIGKAAKRDIEYDEIINMDDF